MGVVAHSVGMMGFIMGLFKRRIWIYIIITVSLFSLFLLSVNVVWYTSYTIPLIALAESILRYNFTIPTNLCIYVDTALINGRCVFAGPIGLPLALSIFILLDHYIDIDSKLFIGGLTTSLFGVLSVVSSWKLHTIITGDSKASLLVSVINAVSGPLWIYSTHLFPQAPLSFAFTFFLYLAFKSVKSTLKEFEYLLGGFIASMAVLFDPSIAITILFASIIVLLKHLQIIGRSLARFIILAKHISLYILGVLPLAAFMLIYNYTTTGNPLLFPEFYMLKRWSIPNYGFTTSPIVGLYILLFDVRKGLFILYPMYVVALIHMHSFIKLLRDRYSKLLYVGGIVMPLIVYSVWYDPGGGLCYGPRFTAPITTLLLAPLVLVLKNVWRERSGITRLTPVTILIMYSVVKNAIVVTTTPYPSSISDLDVWQNQFIHSVVPQFHAGTRSSYIYFLLRELVYTEPIAAILSILTLSILAILIIIAPLML